MNSYFEAYEKPISHVFEKQENPQVYNKLLSDYVNPKAKRHILGIVGGNDMYEVRGNKTDLESDLFGITRPFTWSTERKHLPSTREDNINRKNPNNTIAIDATPIIREEHQMWSYPAVYAPVNFERQTCIPKNKL